MMLPMHETNWERLWRVAEARRERLGLTQRALSANGGPSGAWYRALRSATGQPSPRRSTSLRALDNALGWPERTSWHLLSEDRTDWSSTRLAEEEAALVGMTTDHEEPAGASVLELKQPEKQAEECPGRRATSALHRSAINNVCDSTLNGWLYYCDEHDSHGNAGSQEEAEWLADAHTSFHADQEAESDACEVIVWSRRQAPINELAD
jgi:hypothetical protein